MSGTTLGTAYVQIVPSARGISGSISNVLGGEAESAGKTVGSTIGSFAKKAVVAAGIGTAVVGVIKGAMSEGGKLQQSYFGGLDTLYGEAADSARAYAKEAAKAGVSMNSYSEQAVSFGAALKKAYGGDATKAVEAANTAILDMADNSAKMGTDLGSIQWAYQGFAKQNYTMLDNLKLGYGGTKTEMERLLKDAEALTGKSYDLSNLGDVYEAIHVIQQELGLSGVAAQEAEGTFTGSFGAMKAAAQNFLGQLAIGENVSDSLNVLIGNATTFFFNNFIPMLGTIISSLPAAIGTFLQQGVPALLTSISDLVSTLATSVKGLADKVSAQKVQQWASTMIPKMLNAGSNMIGKFASSLLKSLPKIAAALAKIGVAIVKGLGSALWGKVKTAANGIKERFLEPINSMKDKIKGIIDTIKGWFPFKLGNIISGFKTPHITLNTASKTVLGKSITYPTGFGVKWYKKAESVPYMFSKKTLFGAGERNDEILYGRRALLNDIKEASQGNTFNVTLNANSSESPEQYAQRFVRELRRQARMGTI